MSDRVAGDVETRVVTGGVELDEIRKLLVEYAEWVSVDLSFQGFAEELAGLPGEYVAPSGTLLLDGSVESTTTPGTDGSEHSRGPGR